MKYLLLVLLCVGCNQNKIVSVDDNKIKNEKLLNDIIDRYSVLDEFGQLKKYESIPDKDIYGNNLKIRYGNIDPTTTLVIVSNGIEYPNPQSQPVNKQVKHKLRIRGGIAYSRISQYREFLANTQSYNIQRDDFIAYDD